MPEVITGSRDHQSFPERNEFSGFFPGAGDSGPTPNGNVAVWHSRIRFFTLILTAKKPAILNGETFHPENYEANFADNCCILDLNTERGQKINSMLESHPQHGINKYFWKPAEREKAVMDRRVADAVMSLRDPEFVEALSKRVGAEEFAVVNNFLDMLTLDGKKEAATGTGSPDTGSATPDDSKKKK